jgi:hypothetical protein
MDAWSRARPLTGNVTNFSSPAVPRNPSLSLPHARPRACRQGKPRLYRCPRLGCEGFLTSAVVLQGAEGAPVSEGPVSRLCPCSVQCSVFSFAPAVC